MDLSAPALVAGLVFSTIGFSLFLYGKKQMRLPQLVGGLAMSVLPMVVPGALWITVTGLLAMAGTWFAVRAGM